MSDDFNCPHCGHKHDTTDWFEFYSGDGDDFDIECRNCEEDFRVVPRIEVSYWPPVYKKESNQ